MHLIALTDDQYFALKEHLKMLREDLKDEIIRITEDALNEVRQDPRGASDLLDSARAAIGEATDRADCYLAPHHTLTKNNIQELATFKDQEGPLGRLMRFLADASAAIEPTLEGGK